MGGGPSSSTLGQRYRGQFFESIKPKTGSESETGLRTQLVWVTEKKTKCSHTDRTHGGQTNDVFPKSIQI